jgi:hypothetical protein
MHNSIFLREFGILVFNCDPLHERLKPDIPEHIFAGIYQLDFFTPLILPFLANILNVNLDILNILSTARA